MQSTLSEILGDVVLQKIIKAWLSHLMQGPSWSPGESPSNLRFLNSSEFYQLIPARISVVYPVVPQSFEARRISLVQARNGVTRQKPRSKPGCPSANRQSLPWTLHYVLRLGIAWKHLGSILEALSGSLDPHKYHKLPSISLKEGGCLFSISDAFASPLFSMLLDMVKAWSAVRWLKLVSANLSCDSKRFVAKLKRFVAKLKRISCSFSTASCPQR